MLSGGRQEVGTSHELIPGDGEGPPRRRQLRNFRISSVAVTNADFSNFVSATGYVTQAEQIGWSAVFYQHLDPEADARPSEGSAPRWWSITAGASWRSPGGGRSTIKDSLDHPAVHLSLRDALAYASWVGGRLPTEAEWEHAAQGGIEHSVYPWGDREPDDDAFQPCNIWQGSFPRLNTQLDGYAGTCPVTAFAPNGYGFYNMAGNVWEWTSDRFRVRSMAKQATRRNTEAATLGDRVIKGGSYLCHASYCHRYRIAARSQAAPDTATAHLGVRLAFDD